MSDVNLQGSFGGQGGSSLMFRNKLINGNFDVWQRGTSGADGFLADRWKVYGVVGATSQQIFDLGQTDVPGNPKYFLRSSFAAGTLTNQYTTVRQVIEGVETFAGKKATLSFWAKADANKNMSVEFRQSFGTGGTPSATTVGIGVQKVALTTSWQKYEITIDVPSIAGKTLGTDVNNGLQLFFWLQAGSSLDSSTDSLGLQAGTIDIAQVQLEEGSVASPFEHRPIGLELSLCQRYYFKSSYYICPSLRTYGFWTFEFPVAMRAQPNIVGGLIRYSANGGSYVNFSLIIAGFNGTSMQARTDNTFAYDTDVLINLSGVEFDSEL